MIVGQVEFQKRNYSTAQNFNERPNPERSQIRLSVQCVFFGFTSPALNRIIRILCGAVNGRPLLGEMQWRLFLGCVVLFIVPIFSSCSTKCKSSSEFCGTCEERRSCGGETASTVQQVRSSNLSGTRGSSHQLIRCIIFYDRRLFVVRRRSEQNRQHCGMFRRCKVSRGSACGVL